MSLVLIWPSTVIRSNESSVAARRAPAASPRTASVWQKQSIVANPGSIIPAPLAWAESVTPPARTVQRFGKASVVMIASENASPPSSESPSAARPIPARTSSAWSGTPITPVSPTATERGSTPSAAAAVSRIASASR